MGAAILGLILVVFFLLGVFFPDFEYENSVTVNADQQKCWEVFHDVSKMKAWMDGFESLTLKSGGFLQQGSTYEIVIVSNGERMMMDERITDIKPVESVSFELNNDVLKSDAAIRFDSINNQQTVIRSHYKVTGNNLLWRSILFLSKTYLTSTNKQQMDALKKVIEEG
jgi:uncharacterized membrane protein